MRTKLLLIGCLLVAPSPELIAQLLGGEVSGCYDVRIGPWTPPLDLGADSLTLAPPTRVFFDTVPNQFRAGRLPEYNQLPVAPGALPSTHPFSGWIARGDSIRLVWIDISGMAAEVWESPGGFSGRAHSIWDFQREPQTAPITLTRVDCDSPVPISLEDARPLLTSVLLSDGTRLELGRPVEPDQSWEARRAREFGRTDVVAEGFGLVESLRVRTDESGRVTSILGILPDSADFQALVARVTEEWGPATGTDDRILRTGRGSRMAVWNNRVVALFFSSTEGRDGTWQTLFILRFEGIV